MGLRLEHLPAEFLGKWEAYGRHIGEANPSARPSELSPAVHAPASTNLASRVKSCLEAMRRVVPDAERMTKDSVRAPLAVKCTPLTTSPSVTPVAATKTL